MPHTSLITLIEHIHKHSEVQIGPLVIIIIDFFTGSKKKKKRKKAGGRRQRISNEPSIIEIYSPRAEFVRECSYKQTRDKKEKLIIMSAARTHTVGRKWSDFFPRISFQQVLALFVAGDTQVRRSMIRRSRSYTTRTVVAVIKYRVENGRKKNTVEQIKRGFLKTVMFS